MLAVCGIQSADELFNQIPASARIDHLLKIAPGLSEYEIADTFKELASRNAVGYASFLGAGVYNHYRPVVVDTIVSRGEFLTSYTPYQSEISQGTLTAIFEFQTMICQLTALWTKRPPTLPGQTDGSTAVPEAAMMAVRVTKRERILVARSVHPEYRDVLKTYAKNQGLPVEEFGYDKETGQIDLHDLEAKLTGETACVIIQSPNFFGIVEDTNAAAKHAHAHGALLIFTFAEAVSLGLLAPPVAADIVAGELQSFAISPSYGGPFAGIMASKEKFVRQLPGRLVGETKDTNGNRAFCLTLATREQHIRREKATSNICTNQALIALMATVFMELYGKQGLRELATQNLAKARYLASKIKPRFTGPAFNEFVATTPQPEEVNRRYSNVKSSGGLPLAKYYPELSDTMLLCATEMTKRADMDTLAEVFHS